MYSATRVVRSTALAAVAVVVLAGCGQLSGREDAAAASARRFEERLTASDSPGLCAALAPATREELEEEAGQDCVQAVDESDLPEGGPVRRVDVYGQQARVVLSADTLFLAVFADGWRVTAAGCEPRPSQPYSCELEGR
jgi:hypothetical protein